MSTICVIIEVVSIILGIIGEIKRIARKNNRKILEHNRLKRNWWAMNMPVIQEVLGLIPYCSAFFHICRQLFSILKCGNFSFLTC